MLSLLLYRGAGGESTPITEVDYPGGLNRKRNIHLKPPLLQTLVMLLGR